MITRSVGAVILLLIASAASYAGGVDFWDAEPGIHAWACTSRDNVGVGGTITLSVKAYADCLPGNPYDDDTHYFDGYSSTERDTLAPVKIKYFWVVPTGGDNDWQQIGSETLPAGVFTKSWTAPMVPGRYAFEFTVDDQYPDGNLNPRNDAPAATIASVTVYKLVRMDVYNTCTTETGKADHFIQLKDASADEQIAAGNVVVTAQLEPAPLDPAYIPDDLVEWTGGHLPVPGDPADPANRLQRWVSKKTATDQAGSIVTAKCGTPEAKSVTIHILDAESPSLDTPYIQPEQTNPPPVENLPDGVYGHTQFGFSDDPNYPNSDPNPFLAAYFDCPSAKWVLRSPKVVYFWWLQFDGHWSVDVTDWSDVPDPQPPNGLDPDVNWYNACNVVHDLTTNFPCGVAYPFGINFGASDDMYSFNGYYCSDAVMQHEYKHVEQFLEPVGDALRNGSTQRSSAAAYIESTACQRYFDCGDASTASRAGFLGLVRPQVIDHCKALINDGCFAATEGSTCAGPAYEVEAYGVSEAILGPIRAAILAVFGPC